MKQKSLSMLIAGLLAVSLLTGCANDNGQPAGGGETQGAVETGSESGKVELKIWAEDSTFDTLNQMVDSFKEQYKG